MALGGQQHCHCQQPAALPADSAEALSRVSEPSVYSPYLNAATAFNFTSSGVCALFAPCFSEMSHKFSQQEAQGGAGLRGITVLPTLTPVLSTVSSSSSSSSFSSSFSSSSSSTSHVSSPASSSPDTVCSTHTVASSHTPMLDDDLLLCVASFVLPSCRDFLQLLRCSRYIRHTLLTSGKCDKAIMAQLLSAEGGRDARAMLREAAASASLLTSSSPSVSSASSISFTLSLLRRLIAPLASVETHLLHGHSTTALHHQLLIHALLTSHYTSSQLADVHVRRVPPCHNRRSATPSTRTLLCSGSGISSAADPFKPTSRHGE